MKTTPFLLSVCLLQLQRSEKPGHFWVDKRQVGKMVRHHNDYTCPSDSPRLIGTRSFQQSLRVTKNIATSGNQR
jgi:hypothetical protein